jgi:hypothetical protein
VCKENNKWENVGYVLYSLLCTTGVRGQRPQFFFSGVPPTFFFRDDIFPGPHDIRWFFGTWFFADGFLFPVKELGFWTNPGHWVRVLDAAGSYMYIVL